MAGRPAEQGVMRTVVNDLDLLQWQAQDVAQPPAAVSPPDDEAGAALSDDDEAGADSAAVPAAAAVLAAGLEPPRKSVAYQPEPLS